MKTILLPTDFSDNAQNAINYAVSIFSDEKVKFILLNAYHIKPVSSNQFISDENIALESNQGLEQTMDTILKNYPEKNPLIETVSTFGYPVDCMEEITKNQKIDLIVMGTKGATGLKEVLIGSITADAVKKLQCTVLAIPRNVKFKAPENITFAADFTTIDKPITLTTLVKIARKFNSEISILHVDKKGEKFTEEEAFREMKLHEFFSGVKHAFFSVESSNPAIGILDFVSLREVDMLAMVARKHSFIDSVLNRSVTQKLAMHSTVPLLALK